MPGMVQVERGSNVVKGNMASSLEGGDRIRIGHEFETEVVIDDDMDVDGADDSTFKIKDGWKLDSACKYENGLFALNILGFNSLITDTSFCL